MRCWLVVLVVALAVSGCLGSGAGDDDGPAPGRAGDACDRPLAERVEVPDGAGAVPIGGYANLVAAGEGHVWTLVTRERGGERVVVGIDPRTGDTTRWPYAGSEEARIRAAGGAVWLADPQTGTVTRFDARTGADRVVRVFGRHGGPKEIAAGAGALWAIPGEGRAVAELSLATGAIRRRIVIGDGELADVAVAGGRVWLTTGDEGGLLELDARTGRPLRVPVRLGKQTLDVEASPDEAWVDLGEADALAAVDVETGRVLHARVPNGGGDVFAIALGYGSVWATNYARASVTRIDPQTGERIGDPLPTGETPKGIATGEGAVWVANAGACTLTRIEP